MGWGSRAVVGLSGRAPSLELERWIRHYRPAGFILFERNIGDQAEEVFVLNQWLKDLVMDLDGLPPLLAIDHEGGKVHRLKGHATRFPPWRQVVNDDPQAVFETARCQGRELRSLGFNWLLGPVADLAPEQLANGATTVLGQRTMGSTAADALPHLRAFMRGCHQAGVLTCLKHFPGYGGVTLDPHEKLPCLNLSPAEWRKNDLASFTGLLPAAPDAIMLAHLRNGLFGSDLPASLDPAVVSFLRKDLAFEGVILPDDLAMGAITGTFGWKGLGRRSVAAGLDILLVCHPDEPHPGAIGALLDELESESLSSGDCAASLERIRRLRKKVHTSSQPFFGT